VASPPLDPRMQRFVPLVPRGVNRCEESLKNRYYVFVKRCKAWPLTTFRMHAFGASVIRKITTTTKKMNQPQPLITRTASSERHCDLPRGTRGEAQWQPAFEVAHLAAGGRLFLISSQGLWPVCLRSRHRGRKRPRRFHRQRPGLRGRRPP